MAKYTMIHITENARLRLVDVLQASNEQAILLSVNTKGCGGHSYQMAFASAFPPDEIVSLDEVRCIIIDPTSAHWLVGVSIDFIDSGLDSGFMFVNPQESAKCGCQQSFMIKK